MGAGSGPPSGRPLALARYWPWAVITAYIVASGNRGRADVLHKGWLRVLGTAVGAALGTVLIGPFPPAATGRSW